MSAHVTKCQGGCITPEERQKILSRFNSLLFWVGESIPDSVMVDDEEVPLKDVVFQFITIPCPSDDTIRAAHELAHLLEKKAKATQENLTAKKVEREKAYEMMHEALGLLRAVDHLRNLKRDECQLKANSLMNRVNDERRWLEFVRSVKC